MALLALRKKLLFLHKSHVGLTVGLTVGLSVGLSVDVGSPTGLPAGQSDGQSDGEGGINRLSSGVGSDITTGQYWRARTGTASSATDTTVLTRPVGKTVSTSGLVLEYVRLPGPNGLYEGEVYGGRKHGLGVFTWNNGCTYEGQWLNGVMSGYGVFRSDTGGLYEGQWLRSAYEGYGRNQYPNGCVHQGYFVGGHATGEGLFYAPDGFSHNGMWDGGLKEGLGVTHFSDGSTYTGEYSKDLKHGLGTMILHASCSEVLWWQMRNTLTGCAECCWGDGRLGASYDEVVFMGIWKDDHFIVRRQVDFYSDSRFSGGSSSGSSSSGSSSSSCCCCFTCGNLFTELCTCFGLCSVPISQVYVAQY